MPLLQLLARAFLIRRLLRGSRQRHSGWGRPRHRHPGWGYGRPHRRPSGWGRTGPFPSYSRRTRRGSRVTVTGCCLPIPLALTLATAAGLGRAVRHRRP
jgi:hypothetical protein